MDEYNFPIDGQDNSTSSNSITCCIHELRTSQTLLIFITSLLYRGKTQWVIKVSAIPGKYSDSKTRKTVTLYRECFFTQGVTYYFNNISQ